MEINDEARITDLEAKLETLQALVTREAQQSAELRKEIETLKRDAKIFYGAFGRAHQTFKRIHDYTLWVKGRVEAAWELSLLNDERGEILARRDKHHSHNIDALKSTCDFHQVQIERLLQAYYRVFPERVDQDYEFLRQMDVIEGGARAKPALDADPKEP
jgi:chromosome segregation ATPase